jgi:hypothetical protein
VTILTTFPSSRDDAPDLGGFIIQFLVALVGLGVAIDYSL